MALYCPQGSGTLRQQLTILHILHILHILQILHILHILLILHILQLTKGTEVKLPEGLCSMLQCCLFFVAICLEEGLAVPFGELVSRQGGDHDNDAAVCQRHNHCVTDTDAKWGPGTLTCQQNQLPLLQISAFQWNYSLFPIRI